MNWIFFLVWKQTGYFYQFKLDFFPSFWARVKYFDGPCLTIYSLFTIYRDIHYQLLVWWIHYTHCCESKKWKPGKFHLCSLWNDILNYPNWACIVIVYKLLSSFQLRSDFCFTYLSLMSVFKRKEIHLSMNYLTITSSYSWTL